VIGAGGPGGCAAGVTPARWRRSCSFTHTADGLTEADFVLAVKLDELFGGSG